MLPVGGTPDLRLEEEHLSPEQDEAYRSAESSPRQRHDTPLAKSYLQAGLNLFSSYRLGPDPAFATPPRTPESKSKLDNAADRRARSSSRRTPSRSCRDKSNTSRRARDGADSLQPSDAGVRSSQSPSPLPRVVRAAVSDESEEET